MGNRAPRILGLVCLLLCGVSLGHPGVGLPTGGVYNLPVPINKRIGFDQHLDAAVPGDLPFVDENGRAVHLKDYFGRGPVVLALVYYGCPNLCTLALNGLFKALDGLKLTAGSDYQVVAVSIDPTEAPKLAAEKRRSYLKAYGRGAKGASGIHFLTGKEDAISRLTKTVGFRYVYDAEHHQYAHPAGVTILTPDGKISRYLFGVEYAGNPLRLALYEASEKKIGTFTDSFLLFCYHYEPAMGTYTFRIQQILRAAAGVFSVGLFLMIGLMLRSEHRATAKALEHEQIDSPQGGKP